MDDLVPLASDASCSEAGTTVPRKNELAILSRREPERMELFANRVSEKSVYLGLNPTDASGQC